MPNLKRTLTFTSLAFGCLTTAWSIQPLGPGHSPAPAGQAHAPVPSISVAAVTAAALRAGTISSVSQNHQSAVINGATFKINPRQTRVFRSGLEVGATGLRPGENIRFNLSTADATQSTLGVVYVN